MSFENFEYFDNESLCLYPITSTIRYVLWYFDKNGTKTIIKETYDFDEVKWDVGRIYPQITVSNYNDITEGSRSLLNIEEIQDNKQWINLLTYTRNTGKRIVIYEKNYYMSRDK